MSKKKAREVYKNLYSTIMKMTDEKPIHNDDMFGITSPRADKKILKKIYNNLIKKYGFRRRLL